jgi:hypothetical protein
LAGGFFNYNEWWIFRLTNTPAAKALLDACKGIKDRNSDLPAGEYMGFNMSLRYESFGSQVNLLLRGAMTYQINLGTDALGNITRINNALNKLPERLKGAQDRLADIEKQIDAAKSELEKPFSQETELAEKEARLALLNADLNIDGDGNFDVANDPRERDEDEPETADGERDGDDDEPSGEPFTPANPGAAATYDGMGGDAGDNELRTGTYGKRKPSIIDGIRGFAGAKMNDAPKPPQEQRVGVTERG